jgi:RNA polymerase sigma factor (TIGR02999 family)
MKVRESLVPPDVSDLLVRWSAGDEAALERVIAIVYRELRRLARSAVRREGGESVLQPTELVHEAWLQLVRKKRLSIESRGQFFALAAKIMRDILVDQLRRRHAAKRGGSQIRIDLDNADRSERPRHVDFLILDNAISRLGAIKSRYAQIAELRFMAGLTIEETAETLKISHATVEREWNFARAWLRRELRSGHGAGR